MNRFEIFYLMALIYISYSCVSAEEKLKELCPIKGARIESYGRKSYFQMFDSGDVTLYEVENFDKSKHWKWLKIGDDMNVYSDRFRVSPDDTVVTKNRVTVGWLSQTITLMWNENDNAFPVYQKLFPFGIGIENFPGDFRVKQVLQDDEQLIGVTAVKLKKTDGGQWLLVAVDGDEPRLIFPYSFLLSLSRGSDGKMIAELNTKPKMIITIIFDNSANANGFYNFIMTP